MYNSPRYLFAVESATPVLWILRHDVGSVGQKVKAYIRDIHDPWHSSYDHKVLSLLSTLDCREIIDRNLYKIMGKIMAPFYFPLNRSIRSVGHSTDCCVMRLVLLVFLADSHVHDETCQVPRPQMSSGLSSYPIASNIFFGSLWSAKQIWAYWRSPACEPGEGGKPAVGPAAIWFIGRST